MIQITWTKCREQMPPKHYRIIVRSNTDKAFLSVGHELHSLKIASCRAYGTEDNFNSYEYEWAPYTEEAWAKLSKKNKS